MKRIHEIVFASFLLALVACELDEFKSKKKAFESWTEFREEVDSKKNTIREAEREYNEFLQSWNEKVSPEMKIDIPEHLQEDPVKRVEQWIKKRIEMEEPITYEGLIDEIESLNDQIAKLQLQIDKLESESGFSEPYVVRRGDTHYKLALHFFSEKQSVRPEEATKLIRPVALWDELLEGFYVYFLYDGENFYTSVSQGSARISPNVHKARLDKKRQEKIEKLTQLYKKEKNEYQKAIERIDDMRQELQLTAASLTELEDLYESTIHYLTLVQYEADSLDRISNSVFYEIVSLDELVDQGLFRKGLFGIGASLRLGAFDELLFSTSIDVRETSSIELNTITRKGKVLVFDQGGKKLKMGADYSLRGGNSVVLNWPSRFLQERILIVLS